MDSMDTVSEVLDSIAAIAGVTRKKMPAKFYVVKAGKAPGVYYNWDDCLAQVKGFKGAVCEYCRSISQGTTGQILTIEQSSHSPP